VGFLPCTLGPFISDIEQLAAMKGDFNARLAVSEHAK
jgi:hypothetical protein